MSASDTEKKLPEVVPPGYHFKIAGHHWLEIFDCDGHFHGYIVLQWQPVSKQWCHSNRHAVGEALNVEHYRYLAPCPIGLLRNDQKRLKDLLERFDRQQAQWVRRQQEPRQLLLSDEDMNFMKEILDSMLYRGGL